jgi:hypothetical protein
VDEVAAAHFAQGLAYSPGIDSNREMKQSQRFDVYCLRVCFGISMPYTVKPTKKEHSHV